MLFLQRVEDGDGLAREPVELRGAHSPRDLSPIAFLEDAIDPLSLRRQQFEVMGDRRMLQRRGSLPLDADVEKPLVLGFVEILKQPLLHRLVDVSTHGLGLRSGLSLDLEPPFDELSDHRSGAGFSLRRSRGTRSTARRNRSCCVSR